MLERAAGCLESGGRSLLRAHQALRTKRMLHSTFWHHGAGDLTLPPYMLPSMLGDVSRPKHSDMSPLSPPDGFLLEFLYPPRSRAFLRDLASSNGEKLERHHGRRTHLNRYREYSSVASGELQMMGSENENFTSSILQTRLPTDDTITSSVYIQPNCGDSTMLEYSQDHTGPSTALEGLQKFLRSRKKDAYEEAWRIMITADPSSPAYGNTSADMIEYLSNSVERIDAERVLRLFMKLEKDSRRPSSYRAAIAANLRLRKLGKAVLAFQEAADSAIVEDIGADVLLEQIVQCKYWHLGSQVCESYRAALDKQYNEESLELWRRVKDTAIPLTFVMSLLDSFQQFSQCFNEMNTPAFMTFFRDLSIITLKQQSSKLFLHAQTSQQKQVDEILRLIKYLRHLRVTNAELYEALVFKLNHRAKIRSPAKSNFMYSLYENFRKETFFSPSQQLLKIIMSTLCYHEPRDEVLRESTKIEDVAKDWAKFHGYLSNEAVQMMLETFGRAGEVKLVHKYFGYLESPSKRDLQRSFFWLIYVHTSRADLNKAIWQFERMTQEFSVPPDRECYNALLQAYSRNDDLEGASQRFREMETNNVVPDAHTFGILMGMYADRGVPQHVSELFSVANSHNINPTSHMWAALVRAHIENDDLVTAENIAEESSRSRAITESMTIVWNQVLTAHALRRDLESTSRVFEHMRSCQIPPDSLTYAALMQCLVLLRQYDAARKILQKVIPQARIKLLALHYAILMGGYVESKQWSRVLGLDAVIRRRGIRPTVSTRIPVLRAQAAVEAKFSDMRSRTSPDTRLMTTEQALSDVLDTSDRRETTSAIKQPSYGLGDSSMSEAYPDAYYQVLISTYGRRYAFDIVDDIFDEYLHAKEQPSPSSFMPPLKLLTTLMQSHWRAREYDHIEKCWSLIYRKAMHLIRVSPVPKPVLAATSDEVQASLQLLSPSRMAPSRRHIISRPLTYFIRSLSQRGEISRMISLIDELTRSGWILSNRVWNLYVQTLAKNSHVLLAFEVCEERLMPGWPGWRHGNALRRNPPMYQKKGRFDRMDTRIVLPKMLLPQYPTIVILARTLLDVQRASAYAAEGDITIREIRDKAPKAVRAVETMPLVKHDSVQRNILRGGEGSA